MFLLPGYAIVMHCTGLRVPEHYRLEIIRYLTNLQGTFAAYARARVERSCRMCTLSHTYLQTYIHIYVYVCIFYIFYYFLLCLCKV